MQPSDRTSYAHLTETIVFAGPWGMRGKNCPLNCPLFSQSPIFILQVRNVEYLVDTRRQYLRAVVFGLRVDIHGDFGIFVPRQILHRLGIYTGVNQVGDICMPQHVRRYMEID